MYNEFEHKFRVLAAPPVRRERGCRFRTQHPLERGFVSGAVKTPIIFHNHLSINDLREMNVALAHLVRSRFRRFPSVRTASRQALPLLAASD